MPKIEDISVHGMNVGSIKRNERGALSGDVDAWALVALAQILRELEKLNRLLHCGNATDIPNILRKIEKNTRKRKKPKAVKQKPART